MLSSPRLPLRAYSTSNENHRSMHRLNASLVKCDGLGAALRLTMILDAQMHLVFGLSSILLRWTGCGIEAAASLPVGSAPDGFADACSWHDLGPSVIILAIILALVLGTVLVPRILHRLVLSVIVGGLAALLVLAAHFDPKPEFEMPRAFWVVTAFLEVLLVQSFLEFGRHLWISDR
jgi:hypothetical protein